MAEGRGYLRVRVTEAGGARPVGDAVVRIAANGEGDAGRVLYTLRTDRDGLTESVALTAPPATLSQSPGVGLPYAEYHVTVLKEGYDTVENVGVAVFDGIRAVQPVLLLPLGEEALIGGQDGTVTIIENAVHPLVNGKGEGQ